MENIGSHRWCFETLGSHEYIKFDSLPDDIEFQRNNLGRKFYNRDSAKPIVILFQSGAGGLFLANCLSLSPSVCSYFSLKEKITLWKEYLDSQKIFWNDLYLNNAVSEFDDDMEGYFFIFDHSLKDIDAHLDFWSNCNIIYFKNPDLFCHVRKILKNVRGILQYKSFEPLLDDNLLTDKTIPNSFSEFSKLSRRDQNKLKITYQRDDLDRSLFAGKRLYVWDTNWYFSEEDTLIHVKELYDFFGMKNFNEKIISLFYKKWIYTLDKLSKTELAENPYKFNVKNLLSDIKHQDISITSLEDLSVLNRL